MTESLDHGLIRYWFEFDYEEGSLGWRRGPVCAGVTAVDLDDAKQLLTELFFEDIEFPAVAKLVEGVDVSSITFPTEAYRSINYAPPIWRGVWYPPQSQI